MISPNSEAQLRKKMHWFLLLDFQCIPGCSHSSNSVPGMEDARMRTDWTHSATKEAQEPCTAKPALSSGRIASMAFCSLSAYTESTRGKLRLWNLGIQKTFIPYLEESGPFLGLL